MLRLVQIDNGQFDLDFADPAAADNIDEVETIIYAALFTDQEAPDDRVADQYDRRGWWAGPAAGDTAASPVRARAIVEATESASVISYEVWELFLYVHPVFDLYHSFSQIWIQKVPAPAVGAFHRLVFFPFS